MSHISLVSLNFALITSVTMDQLPVQPSEVPLSQDMPFLKVSISHVGLRTPPSSPEDAKSSPHHPRFLLPKFLRRTRPNRSPTFLARNGPSANGPARLIFAGDDNAPSHPSCSPFRAVQHMKEPFPLVLPASPAPSDHSANERSSPQRLRKAPLSYQNLRAVRQEQHLEPETSKPIALLPSPVFSELQVDQISGSCFPSLTPNDQQSSLDATDQASLLYEGHAIFSSYYENDETQTCGRIIEDTNEASSTGTLPDVKQRHDTRRDVGIVCAPTSFLHYQGRPQRDRSRSCSSEADWLAGNMSEKIMLEEWLCDLHQSETPAHNQEEEDGDNHQIVGVQSFLVRISR
jgi:hypothetical protein